MPDGNLANNSDTETVGALFADVTTEVDLPASAPAGSVVSVTVTFTNSASGATATTASAVVGTVTLSNGQVQTYTVGELAPGASVTYSFTTTVPGTTGTVLEATSTVATSTPESNTGNNSDVDNAAGGEQLTPLFSDPGVNVQPIPSGSPGSTVTTTVTLSNSGSTTVSFTPVVVVNGVSTTLTAVTLSPGQTVSSAPISVPLTATGATVTANVTAPSVPDGNLANNSDTETITVATAVVSGRVFYDTDRNRFFGPGDQGLAGYRVELLPGGSDTPIGTAVTNAAGEYNIGGMPPGTGYRLQFRDPSGNVILGTPFNQSATTEGNNPSTGSNTLFSPVAPGSPVTVAGVIQGITLYAGDNVFQQNLPLDPSGVVYDSVTRQPLAGATVRLVGPSGFDPATQLLGGTNAYVTDASGLYQFLFVNSPPSGVYTLEVTPPANYLPPVAVQGGVSAPAGTLTVPAGITNVQPQAVPPAVGASTTYHLALAFNFAVPGEVFNNHIPLDPVTSGALLVNKAGDRSVAEIGDSVRYTIRLTNTTAQALNNVVVEDVLPAGFRYIPGTARLIVGSTTSTVADPASSTGRSLSFVLPAPLTGNSVASLSYFVRLGVGSQQGDGINRATGVFEGPGGSRVRSNTSAFKVSVQGGVFSNEGCIVGKVYSDCDGNHVQNNVGGSRELGIPGVRLVMLDGTNVITDAEGKYSLCGVKPQTHVIKVDRKTLPVGSRMLPSSNRNAGDGNSLFVDMKGGEMARADFIEGSCSPQVLDQIKARRALGGDASPETEKGPLLRIQPGGESPLQQILPAVRPVGAAGTGGSAQ